MNGTLTHVKNWGEDVNAIVEEQRGKPGFDELAVAFLAEVPSQENDSESGYATVRNATVLLPAGVAFKVAFLRIDLEHVAAWWLRPQVPIGDDAPGP